VEACAGIIHRACPCACVCALSCGRMHVQVRGRGGGGVGAPARAHGLGCSLVWAPWSGPISGTHGPGTANSGHALAHQATRKHAKHAYTQHARMMRTHVHLRMHPCTSAHTHTHHQCHSAHKRTPPVSQRTQTHTTSVTAHTNAHHQCHSAHKRTPPVSQRTQTHTTSVTARRSFPHTCSICTCACMRARRTHQTSSAACVPLYCLCCAHPPGGCF